MQIKQREQLLHVSALLALLWLAVGATERPGAAVGFMALKKDIFFRALMVFFVHTVACPLLAFGLRPQFPPEHSAPPRGTLRSHANHQDRTAHRRCLESDCLRTCVEFPSRIGKKDPLATCGCVMLNQLPRVPVPSVPSWEAKCYQRVSVHKCARFQ